MATKPKCSTEGCERDSFSKGLCSGCYGREWRLARKEQREMVIPEPRQLTDGVIEGEVIHDEPRIQSDHLVATSPAEMQMARSDLQARLEQKLAVIEREIVEANAALNEARRNGWATGALTSARNRLVDDETFYNKVLAAVEAGHTIIPDFPIEVFAVRRSERDPARGTRFHGVTHANQTHLGDPAPTDCSPAGAGEYRNPQPQTTSYTWENTLKGAQERGEPRYYTDVRRTGYPAGPISFPSMTARSPVMRATAEAMKDKVFDQFGVCFPTVAAPRTSSREVQAGSARAGDPLVIGQVVHKRVGSRQRVVSFIIAWYLNLNEL